MFNYQRNEQDRSGNITLTTHTCRFCLPHGRAGLFFIIDFSLKAASAPRDSVCSSGDLNSRVGAGEMK